MMKRTVLTGRRIWLASVNSAVDDELPTATAQSSVHSARSSQHLSLGRGSGSGVRTGALRNKCSTVFISRQNSKIEFFTLEFWNES